MPIVIDEAFLPATITASPMSDDEFEMFCSEHPDLSFEMTAEGIIIITAPHHSVTGIRNQEIIGQLQRWTAQDGRGVGADASTGFVLPNGARRSPDAAWIGKSRLQQLSPESLERFWHLCADFVIQLRSHSNRLRTLREKMDEWIANGAQLGWLIDPEARSVEVFRPNVAAEIVTGDFVSGEGPVEGFVLHLPRVWNPLGK